MGKYTSYTRTPPKPRNPGVHPVVRGIGCIMMVVIPILAYGIALLVVDYAIQQRWPLPPEWLRPITIHPLLLGIRNLEPVWNILLTQNNFMAVLVFTLAIIVVLGSIMAVLYGYMYSMFGPPRYGPQDAPPIRVKVKRYKR